MTIFFPALYWITAVSPLVPENVGGCDKTEGGKLASAAWGSGGAWACGMTADSELALLLLTSSGHAC